MDKKRNLTCCFTGHRLLPQSRRPEITRQLIAEMETLIGHGVIYFGCGGALGFDAEAGFTTLALKEKHPQIKLIMVLPCRNQDARWREPDKQRYQELLARSDKIVYIADQYIDGCMLTRNRHLVQSSGTCIAYLSKPSGGTAFTVNYAQQQGLSIINIAELLEVHQK